MKKIYIAVGLIVLLLSSCAQSWRGDRKIAVYTYKNENSGLQWFDDAYGFSYGESTKEVESVEEMLEAVQEDPCAIGFIPTDCVVPEKIRQLTISAEKDSQRIKRCQIWSARPAQVDNGSLQANFYGFIISAIGQQQAEALGYTGLVEKALPICGACYKPPGEICVAVSEELLLMAEKLRDAYYAYNKQADIRLITSPQAEQEVAEGQCEIAVFYGPAGQNEQLKYTLTAQIDYVVIVNADNPIEELTEEQLCAVFSGDTVYWAELQ